MDIIDARYGLASSLSTMGDMISCGAILPGLESGGQATACERLWEEAKIEFVSTFDLQVALASEQVPPTNLVSSEVQGEADESATGDEGAMADENVSVQEFYTVTPSVMIDTLLGLMEPLLSLLPTQPTATESLIRHYSSRLLQLNALAESSSFPLSRKIEIENVLINAELSVLDQQLSAYKTETSEGETSPSEALAHIETRLQHIVTRLDQLSSAYEAQPTSSQEFQTLTTLADNHSLLSSTYIILRSCASNTSSAALDSLLLRTLHLHSAIQARLQAYRLNPIPGTHPHDLGPMQASSLIGQSEAHLLRSPTDAARCFGLFVEAYNHTKGAFQLTVSQSIRLQLVPTPLPDQRHDWPCLDARLEALKGMLRSKALVLCSSSEVGVDHQVLIKTELMPLINKFDITSTDLDRFMEEIEGDALWCLLDGRERSIWHLLCDQMRG